MDDDIDFDVAAYDKATAEGERILKSGILARSATYDATSQRLRIDLMNGTTVLIPAAHLQDLSDASDAVRATVRVEGSGYGLHWPALDLDLSVPGLLAGVFGTRAWMDRLRAAHAGKATSPAKAAAARANGAKGGRPRKTVA